MTYSEAYQHALALTEPNARPDRAFDLSCLMQDTLGIERYVLSLRGDQPAPVDGCARFFELAARWQAGEPLQYLLGSWEFYGLSFEVGPGVLIPRPDTETLVEAALELLGDAHQPRIADLCAGSGCIAITLATRLPGAQVHALEKMPDALAYLRRNNDRHGGHVEVHACDVLTPPAIGPLDLVVSNPPYISSAEMQELDAQVRQEPETALFGGEDGLDFYRALPTLYWPLLRPGGGLLFEVGFEQADAVSALLEQAGYVQTFTRADLAGIRRVVGGLRP